METLTRVEMMLIFKCSSTKLCRLEKSGRIPAANRNFGYPRWDKRQIEQLLSRDGL